MLFRTRFEPTSAMWQLQIKEPIAWFLPARWKTVMTSRMETEEETSLRVRTSYKQFHSSEARWINSPRSFESYAEALKYVEAIGLAKQYAQFRPDSFGQFISAGGAA